MKLPAHQLHLELLELLLSNDATAPTHLRLLREARVPGSVPTSGPALLLSYLCRRRAPTLK